jgi:SPP1 family predicted phage head-tail adaptor
MAGALTNRGRGNGKTVGRLRHRVKIQRLDESTRDASGQVVPTWVDVATVFASVEAVGGREMLASGQVQADTTYRVCMRHREDVGPKNRLIWVTSKPANKVLNLTAAPPTVGVGNSLELVCVEENTGG